MLYTTGGHTTNAVLIRKLPYDPVEGFTAITMLTRSQGFGLIVAGNSRFKTIDEYLAAARAEPGKITYGSSGIGNTTHVVGELFCRSAKVQPTHVPYKSTPIADAMAGTIDSFFVSPSLMMSHLQAGKLRALGISSAQRTRSLPDTPTFGEYGIEADIPAWSGFWGPPNLPAAIVEKSLSVDHAGGARRSRSKPIRATMAAKSWNAACRVQAPMSRARLSATEGAAAARHPGGLRRLPPERGSPRIPRLTLFRTASLRRLKIMASEPEARGPEDRTGLHTMFCSIQVRSDRASMAPACCATTFPSRRSMSVGMLRMLYRAASSCSASCVYLQEADMRSSSSAATRS